MPDFPYVNARVRAMRSRLLSPGRLEELLGAPTFEAFLQALAATPYGDDLQEALVRAQGVRAVDEALARNLQRTTRAILSFADGQARALLETLLLRWDLHNLRVIVRGKHAGRPADEIVAALVPAGNLSETLLKELAGYPDMAALAGTLEAVNHPLAGPLAEGVAAYARTQDLLALELGLERAYAGWGLARASGRGHDAAVLREVFRTEIDVANVKTALKLALAGTLPEARRLQFYIPGGAIVTDKLFLGLSDAQAQAAAWERLRVHGFPVKELPGDLVAFERELDYHVVRTLVRYYLGDPLGIDIVVGFLAMKTAEVANLRLIARGKVYGLPREQVRREMLLV
ncbi:MAG: V-type ATPase subunit [Armatimonadota bacterium]|nr:V-type ATPase subunit [Armatimonadota bacterium]